MIIIIIILVICCCCCCILGGGGYYYINYIAPNNTQSAPSSGSNVSAPSSGSNVSAPSSGSNVSAPSSGSNVSAPSSDSNASVPATKAQTTTLAPTTTTRAPTTTLAPTTTTRAPTTTPEIKIPKFIIRKGNTNWANLIQNGDESDTNIQTWGPPPDNQFQDLNFAFNNQIAAQFRYFAQFWLNKTGKSSGSTTVYAPLSNNLGEYKFSVNGISYTGYFNGTSWSWNYSGDYCFTTENAKKINTCMNGWEFQNDYCYPSGNSNGNASIRCGGPYNWPVMATYSQDQINKWAISCGVSNTSNCK
jgi:hypothetical protein